LTGLLKKGNLESLLKKSTESAAVGDGATSKIQSLFGEPGKKGLGQLKIMVGIEIAKQWIFKIIGQRVA
jgi:hypothetical protein